MYLQWGVVAGCDGDSIFIHRSLDQEKNTSKEDVENYVHHLEILKASNLMRLSWDFWAGSLGKEMSIFCLFKDRDSNLWLMRRVDLSLVLFAKHFFLCLPVIW